MQKQLSRIAHKIQKSFLCIFSFFGDAKKSTVVFTKPYKTVSQQIQCLRFKNMVIDVPLGDAERVVTAITYYRFSGYALPFLDRKTDRYVGNVAFSDILALYKFDKGLRILMSEALAAVEVTFRTIVANEFSNKYGPLGYLDAKNFESIKAHKNALSGMRKEFMRSQQPCAKHFRAKYNDPPLWAAVDVTTFGTIGRLLGAMRKADQNLISTHYGMRGDFLVSYIHHASVLRNLCAHHCRVFDFPYERLVKAPSNYIFRPLKIWLNAKINIQPGRPFLYQAALVYHLLQATEVNVFDRNRWKAAICQHFNSLPISLASQVKSYIQLPNNPAASPLW